MSRSLFYAVSIGLGLIVGTIVMLASSPGALIRARTRAWRRPQRRCWRRRFRSSPRLPNVAVQRPPHSSDRWLVRGHQGPPIAAPLP